MLKRRKRERHCAAAFQINAVESAIDFATDLCGGLFDGNEIVSHVHHAANGARAVKNRRWTAHDFDTLAEQRAYAWSMIGTDIRNIEDFRPVVQHPNSVVCLAANDRATCSSSEPAPTDTWFRFERVA